MYEDENVNRIQEARKLFDDIVNSKWFQATNIVLFLNKSDLFADKIKTVDLKVCFSDYKGGNDYAAASEFMQYVALVVSCVYVYVRVCERENCNW